MEADNCLLSPKQLGAMLGLSRRTLARYENDGLLNPIKLNARVTRYARTDVENMLAKFKQGGL